MLEQLILGECDRQGFPPDPRDVFVALRGDPRVVQFVEGKVNQYQDTGNDLLYALILAAYAHSRKRFVPRFAYAVDERIFDTGQPRLCLALHSYFTPMSALLLEKRRPFVIVSDYPEAIADNALSSGITSGRMEFIPRDETCLLNAKKFLQRNYVVSSTIDFQRTPGAAFAALSDAMLRLAVHLRPVTFFGVGSVSDAGELAYVTRQIDLDDSLDTIKRDVLDFIASRKNAARYAFAKFRYAEQARPV